MSPAGRRAQRRKSRALAAARAAASLVPLFRSLDRARAPPPPLIFLLSFFAPAWMPKEKKGATMATSPPPPFTGGLLPSGKGDIVSLSSAPIIFKILVLAVRKQAE